MMLVRPDTQRRLQTHHPEVAAELDKLGQVLDGTGLNAQLLALCGDYIESNLSNREWAPPKSPGALEAACLDVCEQFMISVSDMREEQIAALRRHLSTDDVYNLMYAIYLIEMSKRLDLTLDRVLQ